MRNGTQRALKTSRQATNFTEAQVNALREIARSEGCSVSDLIRRAAIRHFHLPVDAPNQSMPHQNGAPSPQGQRDGVKDGELGGGMEGAA